MRRLLVILLFALAPVLPAAADPYLIYLAAMYGAQIGSALGPPLAGVAGYGICHTPSIHLFGTDNVTVGLDLTSFASTSRNVYGIQFGFCGGGFAEDLYGIDMSLISCGWVDELDTSMSRMNGLQFAPFAVKAMTVNGFQICPFFARANTVNGFQTGGFYSEAGKVRGLQLGLFNVARRVEGLQLGIYNAVARGHCLQLGLINFIDRRGGYVLPLLNFSFR